MIIIGGEGSGETPARPTDTTGGATWGSYLKGRMEVENEEDEEKGGG